MKRTAPSGPSAPSSPENRLVARTLEARWEAKLAAVAGAGQAPQPAQAALPPLPDRASLAKLAAGLPALWHAPTTTARDRKRLLRTLIADVTLLPEAGRGKARIGIRWHTGAADQIVIDRPKPTGVPAPTPTPATQLIREPGPLTSNAGLAAILAQRGYLTGAGRPFDIKAVQWVRHAYQIPTPSPHDSGEISAADAARRLGCRPGVVYYWIETAQLDARRSPGGRRGRLCIPWTPATEADCHARITSSGHLNPAARRTKPQRH